MLLHEKEKEFADALKKAEVDHAERKKVFDKNEFDARKLSDYNDTIVRIDNLKRSVAENKALLEQAGETHFAVSKQEKELREKISPIFKIERLEDKPKLGYPFKLDFNEPCPTYRYLCALSPKNAKKLKNLLEEETPEACRRYSSFSR